MLDRWQSAFGSVAVMVLAVVLVVLDNEDDDVRGWLSEHALTTNMLSGLVVLALTVLVCDQVLTFRQVRARSAVIAAQAAIVMAQAARSSLAIRNLRGATAEAEAVTGEVQSFVYLLSIATPVLIDTDLTRRFLEDAQRFAAALNRALRDHSGDGAGAARPTDVTYLDQAASRLGDASAPLLAVLSPDLRAAIDAGRGGA